MVDLKHITETWLNQCGPHDFGMLEYGCQCAPEGDPRPVILELVREVERLQKLVPDA